MTTYAQATKLAEGDTLFFGSSLEAAEGVAWLAKVKVLKVNNGNMKARVRFLTGYFGYGTIRNKPKGTTDWVRVGNLWHRSEN